MTECIPFRETNYFSKLVIDYLQEEKKIKSFYSRFPNLENFEAHVIEKQKKYNSENRRVLTQSLLKQYQGISTSEATSKNIESLADNNTFTVTTGHQLNLFTGPLYFLYKILTAINLATELKSQFTDYNFVPVYWMATEDHDFEEINFFNLHGKKFQWNPQNRKQGAVGEFTTEGLDEVFALFSAEIGSSLNAEKLKELFKNAYLERSNLTDATRYLANELFSEYGLVIIDGQDRELKQIFAPYMEEEMISGISYKKTLKQAEALEELGYGVQVNPRELNLFYMEEGLRQRIIKENNEFLIDGTDLVFSREEILDLLKREPEKFSPNVITRPLYEEVILPNLCYIGGGGELAYWFELKDYFDSVDVTFPILLLRNSVLLQSNKQSQKREKLGISKREIFLKQHELINKKVRQISDIDIDFSPEKKLLTVQFQRMYKLSEKTDKSFLGAVKAQEVKQLKGLDNLEKRLLRAQKRKLEDEVTRMVELQQELFPHGMLQERHANFSEFYLEYGEEFISELQRELKPLDHQFKIITL